MKKQFLRILPIVAAVLLATSCSKDDDNAVDNNVTPGTETVAEKQVYYLKVSNGESLSKIALDGILGDGNSKSLKFEGGDYLTLEFTVKYGEGENEKSDNVTIKGSYNDEASVRAFEFKAEDATNYSSMSNAEKTAISEALAVMQTVKANVSSYNVTLTYEGATPNSKTGVYENTTTESIFKLAKRISDNNNKFTLKADGYCYIILQNTTTKTVIVKKGDIETILTAGREYIVSTDAIVAVDGADKGQLSEGRLYYVKE